MSEDISLLPATTDQFLIWLERYVPQIAEPSSEILANEQHRLQYFSQLYHRQEVEKIILLWNSQQEQLNDGITQLARSTAAAASS
jgi:hypothetical protein